VTLPAAIDARCQLARTEGFLRGVALYLETVDRSSAADQAVWHADMVKQAREAWEAEAGGFEEAA
jgi:hypothetical protein